MATPQAVDTAFASQPLYREVKSRSGAHSTIDRDQRFPAPALIEKNKQLCLEFLNLAFSNCTADAVARLHPDLTWWVSGDPKRIKVAGLKNHAQAERLLRGFAKAIPGGMQMLVHGITAEGDRVAVEIEADGAWHDGRRYHNRYLFLLEVRDGMIFAVKEYMDTLHLYELSQD